MFLIIIFIYVTPFVFEGLFEVTRQIYYFDLKSGGFCHIIY